MTAHRHIALRISPQQKAALDRIADDRDVPLAGVLRDGVAGLTGVPDTLKRHTRRGRRHRRATN